MKQIANKDYEQLLKLLPILKRTKGQSLREDEVLRQAKLILKKWSKKNVERGFQGKPLEN